MKPRQHRSIWASELTICCTRKDTNDTRRRLQIENLTNKVALYNFLSTFSGTHFLQPRTVVGRVAFVF